MANKKNATANRQLKAKADDTVVMKVTVALLIMCASLMGLRSLCSYYGTVGGFDVLDPMAVWISAAGLVLLLGCIAAYALVKQELIKALLPCGMLLSVLVFFTGLSMRLFWVTGFSSLYFLCCALFVQYIVLQLYRWEFFFVSLATVSAGFAFFTFRTGIHWSAWNIMTLVIVFVILLGTLFVAANTAKHAGALVLGKKRAQLFSSKFNPTLLFLVSGLWLIVVLGALLIGSLFAYYCMFAAIAVEFIAAVYYTFQLN